MIDYSSIPMSSGVYRLYDGDECVYVGSTKNLYKRIQDQRRKKPFTLVQFDVLPVNLLRKREQGDIRRLRPKLNKQKTVYERTYCDSQGEAVAKYRQIHLYISHEMHEAIEKVAIDEDRKVSNLLKVFIQESLKARGVEPK
jgi:hypothetical protein